LRTCISMAMLGIALSGCATQYQSSGLTGGHYEMAGPGKLEMVNFSGNGFIASDTVRKYALYRCAEVAKKKGKAHFVIYDSLNAAAVDRPTQLPRVGAVGNKPTAFAFMLVLDAPRSGSQETQAVLDELHSLVHPKTK
jgi:hypothetical protein